MPQLDPLPWFSILVFSWLIFLTIIPMKVLGHTFPNEMTAQSTKAPTMKTWNWPWL
uniref:ATP synthase complex subunit 8 n=1 Tax=Peltorhamphus novaezeelandiae TaxID=526620 RepID=W5QKV4_9PLEU|nr:ATP synthase F0 subunit 8 [Peltorhamphus novaezeelandiae]AFH09402.1 ATP synthase F0 subunit 8 [Peltorhamphus novaezeelandiae]